MSVDKNLFLYDLAVVSIMKNEGPYIKEWLNYHLLAGVDHFFIYDNESPDNQREVLQPYIDAGIVTYTFFPGTSPQFPAYDDAVNRFKFLCRYMAFIDGDEFILPKSKSTITEVVDEILDGKPNVGSLGLNWHMFGSSGQKNADYTRDVTERFVYRAPSDFVSMIKDIVNPRRINYFENPHYMLHYDGFYTINEDGVIVNGGNNKPSTDKKIVINHYVTKSYEEYMNKNKRGDVVYTNGKYEDKYFNNLESASTIFDDEILKYRDSRQKALPSQGGDPIKTFAEMKRINYAKLYNALIVNLAPVIPQNVPINFYEGKMETFLICRVMSSYLKEKIFDDKTANFFEEVSLNALHKTLMARLQIADVKLLLSELPNILPLNYPVVKDIRNACINLISQIMRMMRTNVPGHMPLLWREYAWFIEYLNLLKAFK